MKIAFGSLLVLASLAAACVPAPAKTYTPDEVASIESLSELMRIQAAEADPLFGKTSFSDADWDKAARAGAVLRATGERVATRFGGQGEFDDGFVDFAKEVAARAAELETAAEGKDAAAASAALDAMKSTCKGCHGVYR
jgi:mono/diheme cytochrome c family protein